MPVVWDASVAAVNGVGRTRLAGRSFVRVTAGAYLPAASAADLVARCLAVQHVRPDAIMSHWTGVTLLGLARPPTRRGEPMHVLVPPGSLPLRRTGVTCHRTSTPVSTLHVRGVRLTSACRTWCDLARDGASVPELVVVADSLARACPSAVRDLADAVARGTGRRGVTSARCALELVDRRSESAMESWVRAVLLIAGVPAPVPQLVVTDEHGRFVARVDLAWPGSRLVLEYDGDHHRDQVTWVRDLRRREELERLGWTVLVVTVADVLPHPDRLVARVTSRLMG